MIVLPCVYFLGTQCLRANLRSCITISTCTPANIMVVIDVIYASSSWSASAGYSASMLTEGVKIYLSSTRQL